MIDWELPLKKAAIKDVDGDSYGPDVHLRAMLDEQGKYVPLSSAGIDRDTERHFTRQFQAGVRFLVTAERETSKPIYYKADGTPWLSHHARLENRNGARVTLHDRAMRAQGEIKKAELERDTQREITKAMIEERRRIAAASDAAANAERDAIESHPLWGTF